MGQILARVVAKCRETDDVVRLELTGAHADTLPVFSAGAHIDVQVRPGVTRQYSLCNAPDERHRYVIAVLRARLSRGGSVTLHEQVRVGDLIPIGEPKNQFPLVPARRSILFAGGIGIAPILCMAETLSRAGARFELRYCARSERRAAFLHHLAQAAYAPQVHLHFDDGADTQRLDAAAVLREPRADTQVFVCGPPGFIAHITDVAIAHGWDRARIHAERFSAAAAGARCDRSFDVLIASSGNVYHVPPGVPVTTVLAEHGVTIPTSCEDGVCGTCTTRVLDGSIEHRDYYFTSRERARHDRFTPCCSRAATELLVLDL